MNSDVILLVTVVAAALLVFALYWLLFRGRQAARPPARAVERNARGETRAVLEKPRREPIHLEGTGSTASKPLSLGVGAYKVQYQFPAGVLTAVALIDKAEGDDRILFIKAGAGAEQLEIEAAGQYMLRVEPSDETARWQIDIQPLGFR